MLKPVLKGTIIGACVYGIAGMAMLVPAALSADKPGESKDELLYTLVYLLVPMLLSLASGAVLGYLAGRLTQKRRLRLALFTILVYWLDALVVAGVLILPVENYPGGLSAKLSGTLMASISGVLLYGVVLSPLFVGGVLILEYWTRPSTEAVRE